MRSVLNSLSSPSIYTPKSPYECVSLQFAGGSHSLQPMGAFESLKEAEGRHMAAGALIAPTQWACLWGAGGGWESVRESAALLLTIRINCSLKHVLFIWKTYNENNGSKCLKFLPYFYNHLQNY